MINEINALGIVGIETADLDEVWHRCHGDRVLTWADSEASMSHRSLEAFEKDVKNPLTQVLRYPILNGDGKEDR